VGLETALALALTELEISLEAVLGLLSWQPARIARLGHEHGGPIVADRPAHLCVIDPDLEWTVDSADTASRSTNNPYAGRSVRGRVRHTVLRGEVVVLDGEAQR
jgi:dihydroorotase